MATATVVESYGVPCTMMICDVANRDTVHEKVS